MIRARLLLLAAGAALVLAVPGSTQQPRPKSPPRLSAVAETKLLMEGLNQPNFLGLEKTLRNPPKDADSWVFARGQALLIAETGNLLMIRPPNNPGQDEWMQSASSMRDIASKLARAIAAQDVEQSRAGLRALAVTCNQCHSTFRVKVRIQPFAPAPKDPMKEP